MSKRVRKIFCWLSIILTGIAVPLSLMEYEGWYLFTLIGVVVIYIPPTIDKIKNYRKK